MQSPRAQEWQPWREGGSSSLENPVHTNLVRVAYGHSSLPPMGCCHPPSLQRQNPSQSPCFPSYGGIKWPWGHQPQASLTRSFLALKPPPLEGHPEPQGLKQPPGAVGLYFSSPALTMSLAVTPGVTDSTPLSGVYTVLVSSMGWEPCFASSKVVSTAVTGKTEAGDSCRDRCVAVATTTSANCPGL